MQRGIYLLKYHPSNPRYVKESELYVNIWGWLRDNWGLFMGEIMRFRRVAVGFLTPAPKRDPVCLLVPVSTGPGAVFAGEPPERSKALELEFFCLVEGHISSLWPGVSGVKTDWSATYKSSSLFLGELKRKGHLVLNLILSNWMKLFSIPFLKLKMAI